MIQREQSSLVWYALHTMAAATSNGPTNVPSLRPPPARTTSSNPARRRTIPIPLRGILSEEIQGIQGIERIGHSESNPRQRTRHYATAPPIPLSITSVKKLIRCWPILVAMLVIIPLVVMVTGIPVGDTWHHRCVWLPIGDWTFRQYDAKELGLWEFRAQGFGFFAVCSERGVEWKP